jgi:hypothetical protein
MQAPGLASLPFFYCDFRDDQKKGRRGLLSSLLVQLCDQSVAYCTVLSEFYSAHSRGSQHASDSELMQCLHDISASNVRRDAGKEGKGMYTVARGNAGERGKGKRTAAQHTKEDADENYNCLGGLLTGSCR